MSSAREAGEVELPAPANPAPTPTPEDPAGAAPAPAPANPATPAPAPAPDDPVAAMAAANGTARTGNRASDKAMAKLAGQHKLFMRDRLDLLLDPG
ncbi:MAG: hypothetical protein ACRDZY_14760, partial [Acidimicrobiales bacterium]